MTREDFAKRLKELAEQGRAADPQYADILAQIDALARKLPNGFMVIETGEPGSITRLIEDISSVIDKALAKALAEIVPPSALN